MTYLLTDCIIVPCSPGLNLMPCQSAEFSSACADSLSQSANVLLSSAASSGRGPAPCTFFPSPRQVIMAPSGFKYVYKRGGKWAGVVQTAGRQVNCGRYDSERDAALAVDK